MKLLKEKPNLIILTFQTAQQRGVFSLNISEFCFTQKCEFVWRAPSQCLFLVHNSSLTDDGFLRPKERQRVMGNSRAFPRGGSAQFHGCLTLVRVPAEHSPCRTARASLPGEARTHPSAAGGLCSPAGLESNAIAGC